jgi:hypothetical protein
LSLVVIGCHFPAPFLPLSYYLLTIEKISITFIF